MENLEIVTEFNKAVGHPVLFTDSKPATEEQIKLRIALIFEELAEFADASNQFKYFEDLCKQERTKFNLSGEVDRVKVLDSICDMEVVVLGAYNVCGLTDVAKSAFNEVMRSNMSKSCLTEEEAKYSAYEIPDSEVVKVPNGRYLVVRKSDGKVLKPVSYSPPKLNKYIY